MTPSLYRLAAAFAFLLAVSVRADLPIIAKARAWVGTEEALNAIKSIHYRGSLVTPDPTDAKKMTYVSLEMILRTPFRQRIVASSDRSIEVTGLDDYEGWHRVQDPKDPAKWRLQIVPAEQIRRLRANTWENLAFYRGIERVGGKVVDLGPETVDGVACQKLAYVHSEGIEFIRYFERSTGRLVLTKNEVGVEIREKGEIKVNGVRFPKTIVSTSKDARGHVQTVTINFDEVTLNEPFPDSTFAVPSFSTH